MLAPCTLSRSGIAHATRLSVRGVLLGCGRCRAAAASARNPTRAQAAEAEGAPHVTIIGGGAAGLTAAFFAAEHGAKVTVLERTKQCGKKILMSGGTRCNVLPFEVDLQADFFTESSFSAFKAVATSWNLDLCKAWLEDPYWGVGLDLQLEEETSKYFPSSNSSREVRDKLVAACLARGVTFRYNASVEGLQQLLPLPAAQPPPRQPAAAALNGSSPPSSSQNAEGSGGATATALDQPEGDGNGSSDGEAATVRAQPGASTSGAPDTSSGTGSGAGRGGRKGGKRRGTAMATAAEGATPAAAAAATRWVCRLADGTQHVTDKLVIATGGLSFPAVGTDGTGYRILRALGHTMHDTYPALTPLTGPHPAGEQLAGVSMYGVEMSVQLPNTKKPKASRRTAMLFTHRGYSGPCVLDLSHYAILAMQRNEATASSRATRGSAAATPAAPVPDSEAPPPPLPSLRVSWTHEPVEVWDERIRAGGTALVLTLLQRHGIRERLAAALLKELQLEGKRVCDIKKDERAKLVAALTSYPLPYIGHEGYKKAEVTGGGVKLSEIDCATMESRLLPGLHLCGEVLDVFGRIGGFNFYWAWVSGRLAGIGAAQGGVHGRKAPSAKQAAPEASAAAV